MLAPYAVQTDGPVRTLVVNDRMASNGCAGADLATEWVCLTLDFLGDQSGPVGVLHDPNRPPLAAPGDILGP